KARDKARDDEEGQQNRERGQTTEERRTAATNANDEDDAPPPQPPSPPTPPALPPHPERHDDDDHTKSNKTAARARADALHDQEGETVSPGSVPPSVRLEGERIRLTSPYVEATTPDSKPPSVRLEGESGKQSSLNVKSTDVEDDPDDQTTPRDPAGMQDGDTHPPNEPTEPPDEEGRRDGEVRGKSRVQTVETDESSQGDQAEGEGDEGDKRVKSRAVEGEIGGQSEGVGGHQDGRTNDTGDVAGSTSCESGRLETSPLTEDEANQHRNGKPNVTTGIPRPPTSLPYDTPRPTHIANPPRCRGRLKTAPTKVSQPKRTVYAPRLTVVSTTTQSNRMRRKRYGATGGVSQSHHSRGRRAPRPVRQHRTPSTSPIPANYHIG
ncbi:hypothetical protein PAXINDRAFT_21646, partial [Paxillus involutus ATCC 200175]